MNGGFMKFKRFFSILAIALTTLTLTSCGYSEEHDIVKKEYAFKNYEKGFDIKADKLNTYYIDGGKTLYIRVDEFLNDLDGLFKSDKYNYYMTPMSSRYNVTWNSSATYRMTIDYKKETISFNFFTFFNNTYSLSTTNYSYGLNIKDQTARGGGETRFYLKGLFDLHEYKDTVYIPFSLANVLFCSQNYYNIYFNGDSFAGCYIDYSNYSEDIQNEIKTSSLNNQIADLDLRTENYNLLLFLLNNFYGIGSINGTTNYDNLIPDYIKNELLSTDAETIADGYKDLTYYLDDPHTSFNNVSFYSSPDYQFKYDSSKFNTRIKTLTSTRAELKNLYGSNDNILYYDDTALIHFLDFKTGTKNQIYDENNNVLPTAKNYDSYYFMKDAMNQIEAHGNIKNVIMDISQSPGGNLGALYRVLGFLTNRNLMSSFYYDFGDILISETVQLDTNLDNSYADDDSYSNYNWSILTSNFTYSAANSLTSMAKKIGIKQIGEKTGGGACAILPTVLLDGASLYMSGPSRTVNGTSTTTYTEIEYGIQPDVTIERANFYNMEYLDTLFD